MAVGYRFRAFWLINGALMRKCDGAAVFTVLEQRAPLPSPPSAPLQMSFSLSLSFSRVVSRPWLTTPQMGNDWDYQESNWPGALLWHFPRASGTPSSNQSAICQRLPGTHACTYTLWHAKRTCFLIHSLHTDCLWCTLCAHLLALAHTACILLVFVIHVSRACGKDTRIRLWCTSHAYLLALVHAICILALSVTGHTHTQLLSPAQTTHSSALTKPTDILTQQACNMHTCSIGHHARTKWLPACTLSHTQQWAVSGGARLMRQKDGPSRSSHSAHAAAGEIVL